MGLGRSMVRSLIIRDETPIPMWNLESDVRGTVPGNANFDRSVQWFYYTQGLLQQGDICQALVASAFAEGWASGCNAALALELEFIAYDLELEHSMGYPLLSAPRSDTRCWTDASFEPGPCGPSMRMCAIVANNCAKIGVICDCSPELVCRSRIWKSSKLIWSNQMGLAIFLLAELKQCFKPFCQSRILKLQHHLRSFMWIKIRILQLIPKIMTMKNIGPPYASWDRTVIKILREHANFGIRIQPLKTNSMPKIKKMKRLRTSIIMGEFIFYKNPILKMET